LIGRAAFISDPESLADSEADVESHRTTLRRVCPTDDYHDLKTVRESVFQASTFGLLDFVTHMGSQQGQVGLSIGGKILRPNAFFKKDMRFGNTAALVFVNACSSIRTVAQFYSPKSFPQQFIDFHVPAVVASVLPVEPDLALKFGSYFYAALDAGDSIGNALRSARKALMADNSAGLGAERRRLAAAAYCVFGHPMMLIKFEREAN
jgi:CHAT domain